MEKLILFIISILPILLLGIYIYKKDQNKEPSKLLAKLFFGGVLSGFLVMLISIITQLFFNTQPINSFEFNWLDLIIYSYIKIALIEEFSKWLIVYNISYNCEEFDEIYDMIIYCVFVALGFACLENILYVKESGIAVGIVRALSAVPGHACFGAIMGYYLGLAKINSIDNNSKSSNKNKILSILIPTIIHGTYDYCLFCGNLIIAILMYIALIFLYIYTVKKINTISRENKKIKYNNKLCPNCGHKAESNYCPNCGTKMNND